MKKFFLGTVIVLVVTFAANICAAGYFDYYNNHPDYAGIGRMGAYTFVYLPSVHVQEHNPPYYQIGFDCVNVSEGNGNSSERWSYNNAKRYNWNTKESFHLENGYWVKDDVGDYGRGVRNKDFANIIFRAAYGMNFY